MHSVSQTTQRDKRICLALRLLPSQHDSPDVPVTHEMNGTAGWPVPSVKWQMREMSTNQKEDTPIMHGGVGGVSNLLQVWLYHKNWCEYKRSQSRDIEVYKDFSELIVYVQHVMRRNWNHPLILLKRNWRIKSLFQNEELPPKNKWKQVRCLPGFSCQRACIIWYTEIKRPITVTQLYFHKLIQNPHKSSAYGHINVDESLEEYDHIPSCKCIFLRTFMALYNGLWPVKDSLTVPLYCQAVLNLAQIFSLKSSTFSIKWYH